MSKQPNPSGLPIYRHTEKCKRGEGPCFCAAKRKMRKALQAALLGKNKAWKGATITFEGDYTIMRHPSGAVARINTRALGEEL